MSSASDQDHVSETSSLVEVESSEVVSNELFLVFHSHCSFNKLIFKAYLISEFSGSR